MSDNEKKLEDKFIPKFTLNDHPLFRTKEEAEKLIYNMRPLPLNTEPTNEQRFLSEQQPG